MPAPVWGYAAGMVKEPHPKPPLSRPQEHGQAQGKGRTTTTTTKAGGEGGSKKLLKKKKEKEKEGKKKEKEKWWTRSKTEVQHSGQEQRGRQGQGQVNGYQPYQVGKQMHGVSSSSQVYMYPYANSQQQKPKQAGYVNANTNAFPHVSLMPAPGAHGYQGVGRSETEDETSEEEETSEDNEETSAETGEEEQKRPSPSHGQGYGQHQRSWYYTQPLVDDTRSHNGMDKGKVRSQGRHERCGYDDGDLENNDEEEEDEDEEDEEDEVVEEEEDDDESTPRKLHIRSRSTPTSMGTKRQTIMRQVGRKGTILRVKEKVVPRERYEEVSPIGGKARVNVRVRPRSLYGSVNDEEDEDEEEEETTPRRGRGYQQQPQREREREWQHDKTWNSAQAQQAQPHQRSQSAIEERERLVLEARRKARARARSAGAGRGGYGRGYSDENEEGEEGGKETLGLAYDDDDDDDEQQEEEVVFRRRGGGGRNDSSITTTTAGAGMGAGRNRAGLPQPPAMVRDGAGAAIMTGNVSGERKIQGGPRWKNSNSPVSLGYGNADAAAGVGGNVVGRGGGGNKGSEYGGYEYGQNQTRTVHQSAPGAVESGVRGGGWPVDLPRLPRTPEGIGKGAGGVEKGGEGGYFDLRSQSRESASQIQTQNRTALDFSSRERSPNYPPPPSTTGVGSSSRPVSQDQDFTSSHHNHHHYQRGLKTKLNVDLRNLDLDDPPPQASVTRTPSPGAVGGYVLQKREHDRFQQQRQGEQEHERRYAPGNEQGQGQGQSRSQSQMYGGDESQSYKFAPPPQHPQQQLRHGSKPPIFGNQQQPPPQHPFHQPQRKQPQTPAPPPMVGIESPHPVGGRDRMADMNKLEGDGGHEQFSVDGEEGAALSSMMPRISVNDSGGSTTIPSIHIDESEFDSSPMMGHQAPTINVSVDHGSPRKQPREMSTNNNSSDRGGDSGGGPRIQVFDVPGVSVSGPDFDDEPEGSGPMINVSGPGPDEHQRQSYSSHNPTSHARQQPNPSHSHLQRPPSQFGPRFGGQARQGGAGGLMCGGCHGLITNGRIVSAMGLRWHPTCFKCSVCSSPLEHVSSYEHDGIPYCHLDYHEVPRFLFFFPSHRFSDLIPSLFTELRTALLLL